MKPTGSHSNSRVSRAKKANNGAVGVDGVVHQQATTEVRPKRGKKDLPNPAANIATEPPRTPSKSTSIREPQFSTPSRERPNRESFSSSAKKSNRQILEDENFGDQANVSDSIVVTTPRKSFGKSVGSTINEKTTHIYKIIGKSTGSLGGNGHTGPIYGELTIGSMQRIVDALVKDCGMTAQSRFIDVGSGLGKPNFHVAQNPGVRISVGIELEELRWQVI
jgi:hypothetical protein